MRSHELLPLLPFMAPDVLGRVRLPSAEELAGEAGPPTFLLRGPELAALKKNARNGDPILAQGLDKLKELASRELHKAPLSVTDKTLPPEGVGRNDYVSHAIYFWPNPNTADGLPYVRRDGQVNPEALDDVRFDSKRLERVAESLFVLSLCYYLSDDAEIGAHAAALLRTWFVTPETRQTPHLKFAQIVTGKPGGRPEGLVEARRYLYILDAEALLRTCPSWTARDQAGFREWVTAFFQWFRGSEMGQTAAAKDNNIGIWCEALAAGLALFLDEQKLAHAIVRDSVKSRLAKQVDAEGAMPRELARARPYDYVAFNLLAVMGLARVGDASGFDAWWAQTEDGRTFERALDWMLHVVGPRHAPSGLEQVAEIARLKADNERHLDAVRDLERMLETRARAAERARARAAEAEELSKMLAAQLDKRDNPLKAELAKARQRASTLEREIEAVKAELSADQSALTGERERVAVLTRQVEDAVRERQRIDQTLSARVDGLALQLDQVNAALREAHLGEAARIEGLALLAAERECVAALETALAQAKAELGEASAKAAALEQERIRSASLQETLTALERELADVRARYAAQEEALAGALERTETADAEITAHEQDLAALRSVLAEEQGRAQVESDRAAALDRQLSDAYAWREQAETVNARLRDVHQQSLAERARLEHDLREIGRELEKSRIRIAQFEMSTSWRLTEPLRGIVRMVRGEPALPPPRDAERQAEGLGDAGADAFDHPASRSIDTAERDCLNDYVRSLGKSMNALEKVALRNRSAPARDMLARIASGGTLGFDDFDSAAKAGEIGRLLQAIGPKKIHFKGLRGVARVAGNLAVTIEDERTPIAIYEAFISLFGHARLRPLDHILNVDLLTRCGRKEEAAAALQASNLIEEDFVEHAYLLANLLHPGSAPDPRAIERWLEALNAVFERARLEPVTLDACEGSLIMRLRCAATPYNGEQPLISVLMTTFNPDETFEMAVRSVLEQTWRNIELLIVDDRSDDAAFAAVKAWEERDRRVRVMRMEKNQGTYVAKNAALAVAKGEFVTCHDSDDWSHPRKLEIQARELCENGEIIANMSAWVRATPDMLMQRFAGTGRLHYYNTSSLMFRREAVIERCGYYDAVRTGADSEFWRRLELAFDQTFPVYDKAPMSFGQVRAGQLTHQNLGNGYESPDRRAYRAAWNHWHQRAQAARTSVKVGPQESSRRYHAPARILAAAPSESRRFDVIIANDFRVRGGAISACIEEIRANKRAAIRTAVCQTDSFRSEVVGKEGMDARLLHLLSEADVDQVELEESVSCGLLLLRDPASLQFAAGLNCGVRPEQVRIIAGAAPQGSNCRLYDVTTVTRNAEMLFGQQPVWMPTDPIMRDAIAREAPPSLSKDDWNDVMDVGAWACERKEFVADKPVIGRHLRDEPAKWPESPDQLREVYPLDGSARVRILGGAMSAQKLIGAGATQRWEVLEFGAMSPGAFLRGVDYFVYFPHGERLGASSRAIVEAIAAGCVAILPPHFAPLFGDGALYCAPHEVRGLINELYAAPQRHFAQARKGAAFVRKRFDHASHAARMRALLPMRMAG